MRYPVSLLVLLAGARSNTPASLNPDLDFETRPRDLVSRMTVEEKISQLTSAAAVPQGGILAHRLPAASVTRLTLELQ